MDKILKMVDVKQKIKEKELLEADNEDMDDGILKPRKAHDDDQQQDKKAVEKIDPFFKLV